MKTPPESGIAAAGHEETASAARLILEAGGNAFDAVISANFMACVAEPVLSSLGGGGFLLARTAAGEARAYDFFVHTPRRPPPPDPTELDFRPILANFGTVSQEFHIGWGTVATPGMVAGMFRIHRDLGRLPMPALLAPAIELAREGVRITPFQGYLFEVIGAIYRASPSSLRQFGNPARPGGLVGSGDRLRLPDLADTLEALAREGQDWFYRGEMAGAIARESRARGGLLDAADLSQYRVVRRAPLERAYRNVRLWLNPPPSCGGQLIAFSLELLGEVALDAMGYGSGEALTALARAMEITNRARRAQHDAGRDCQDMLAPLLEEAHRTDLRAAMRGHPLSRDGTTHMSVADREGNVASMTVSNGEGCGHLIPGTGVMLNNMLGEQDLNPEGFHRWPPARRMSSMMSPALLRMPDGAIVATGSGGSNRIRSAVTQVLVNLVDYGLPLQEAVARPRIHFEDGVLNVEHGYETQALEALHQGFQRLKPWPERNLFFGGAHSVLFRPEGGFDGAGDPRRAGVCVHAAGGRGRS